MAIVDLRESRTDKSTYQRQTLADVFLTTERRGGAVYRTRLIATVWVPMGEVFTDFFKDPDVKLSTRSVPQERTVRY